MIELGLVLIVIGALIWFFGRGDLQTFGKICAISGIVLIGIDLIFDFNSGNELSSD